jgi:hypothetical protein
MVARQYCAKFDCIAHGCIICSIPGKLLGKIASNQELTKQSDSDEIITATIQAIMEGDMKESENLLSKLKALSLHPVPVG